MSQECFQAGMDKRVGDGMGSENKETCIKVLFFPYSENVLIILARPLLPNRHSEFASVLT